MSAIGLPLETARHATAGPSCDKLHELVVGHIQQRFEFNPAVGKFAELALLAQFGDLFFVHGFVLVLGYICGKGKLWLTIGAVIWVASNALSQLKMWHVKRKNSVCVAMWERKE
jgi:hypothetical protein